MNALRLKPKIYAARSRPSAIKDLIYDKLYSAKYQKETADFVSYLKKTSPHYIDPTHKLNVNRLCSIEDWQNSEIKEALLELQREEKRSKEKQIYSPGFIHRKDWEWSLGITALRRFDKLNEKSTAIGVGAGKEVVIFYLANKLKHVYATDIYQGKVWVEAPLDFPENPQKYATIPYKEDALTVLRMNGTKLEFPSEHFDIAFSFSSIEHFGGENHSGALRSLKEIARVLKRGGIAVITTEYIINDKEHHEFFNRRTIYENLIDKLEALQLVEPLDLRVSTKTLDTVIDYFSIGLNWEELDGEYKKAHPHILLRIKNILFTSLMLVFQKI